MSEAVVMVMVLVSPAVVGTLVLLGAWWSDTRSRRPRKHKAPPCHPAWGEFRGRVGVYERAACLRGCDAHHWRRYRGGEWERATTLPATEADHA